MCLAQAVTPVRLESAAPRSQDKHSSTEPLCSLACVLKFTFIMLNLGIFCSENSVDLYHFAAGEDNSKTVFHSASEIITNI